MKKKITINSPARIHIGFLDMGKNSIRKFGSLGLTITNYSYIIEIEKAEKLQFYCDDLILKEKINQIVLSLKKNYEFSNFKIRILSKIPAHNGLGSGTQLALSIGYLITKLNKIKFDINAITKILKRGLRSGIGIESFKNGGFNIDVGKLEKSSKPPLNILNLKWPREWKIILIIDKNILGIHGKQETKEFKILKEINQNYSIENCKCLLMKIIPGLMEKNFKEFSGGIRIIQNNMSKIFYGKKDKFASKKIEKIFKNLQQINCNSYGQSSWGPTGFVFCENTKKRNVLLNYLEKYINLKNINGIELVKVEGRNFGKKQIIKEII